MHSSKRFSPTGTHQAKKQGTHRTTHPPKCRTHTGKRPQKAPRQRRIPDLWANEPLYQRAFHLLRDHDPRLRLTIYRLDGDHRLKPAVLVCQPFPLDELCDYLRDHLGGGEFCVMIRCGKVMALSVAVSIAPPPGQR